MVYDQAYLAVHITDVYSEHSPVSYRIKRGGLFYVRGDVNYYDGTAWYWVMYPPMTIKIDEQVLSSGGGGNADGTFNVGCTAPSTLVEGQTYTLTVILPADTYTIDSSIRDTEFPKEDYVYEKSATVNVVVLYDTTIDTPTVTIVNRYPEGAGLKVATTVRYASTGNPVGAGKSVKFYYRVPGGTWTQIGGAKTTNTNGYVESDEVVLTAGTYEFKASFEGDSICASSENSVTYVLSKLSTSITLEVIVS